MQIRTIAAVVLAASLGCAAAGARAQDPRAGAGAAEPYAMEQTLRPLTLTRLTLRGDLTFSLLHTDPTTYAQLSLGAGIGITDDFELGATIIPLQLAPTFDFLNPHVYVAGRLVHSDSLQLGLTATIGIPIHSPFDYELGMPLWVGGSVVQLRTGFYYGGSVPTDGAGDYAHHMRIPFGLVIQPVRVLWLGIDSGVVIDLPSRGPYDGGAAVYFPLLFSLGVAIESDRGTPAADLFASFGFPRFVHANGGVDTDTWQMVLGVRGYLTL